MIDVKPISIIVNRKYSEFMSDRLARQCSAWNGFGLLYISMIKWMLGT